MKGWKTVAVNILSALATTLEMTQIVDMIPDAYHLHYALGLAVVNFGLRFLTTTPVGRAQ